MVFHPHPFAIGDSLVAMRRGVCYGTSVVLPNGSAAVPVRYQQNPYDMTGLKPRWKFGLALWRGGRRYRIVLVAEGKRYDLFAFNPNLFEYVIMGNVTIE